MKTNKLKFKLKNKSEQTHNKDKRVETLTAELQDEMSDDPKPLMVAVTTSCQIFNAWFVSLFSLLLVSVSAPHEDVHVRGDKLHYMSWSDSSINESKRYYSLTSSAIDQEHDRQWDKHTKSDMLIKNKSRSGFPVKTVSLSRSDSWTPLRNLEEADL